MITIRQAATTVVHVNQSPCDVYIGRPSKWGNPFSHVPWAKAKWKVKTRADAVKAFEKWFLSQPELIAQARKELKGKVLGCWCKPQACHGDVIARIVDDE